MMKAYVTVVQRNQTCCRDNIVRVYLWGFFSLSVKLSENLGNNTTKFYILKDFYQKISIYFLSFLKGQTTSDIM